MDWQYWRGVIVLVVILTSHINIINVTSERFMFGFFGVEITVQNTNKYE